MKTILNEEKIDICALQECEFPSNFNSINISIPGYRLELEENDVKARTGIYISDTLNYKRRRELEGQNNTRLVKPELFIIQT